MTIRNDIPNDGRDIYVNRSGVSGRAGVTPELAVPSLSEGVALLALLNPPPSGISPASLSASVTGTFTQGLALPRYVSGNLKFASILTSDPVNLDLGGNQTAEIGSLFNFDPFGVCLKIADQVRTRAVVNSVIVSEDGVGFDVSGVCNEIFLELIEGVLLGERATLIRYTATTQLPAQATIGVVTFFDVNQTVVDFNPPDVTDQLIVNIASAQDSPVATKSVAGSTAFRARAGTLLVRGDVLQAETLAIVYDGARYSHDVNVTFGKMTVLDGGFADIKSVGRMDGDILVEPGGKLTAVINDHLGTIEPSDPGDGSIDGVINGVRFGTWRVLLDIVLSSASLITQNPPGTGTPTQIAFGPAVVGTDASVDAAGTITVHKIAQYELTFDLQAGRNINGGVAFMFFRVTVDDVQVGRTVLVKLDGVADDTPLTVSPGPLDLVPGQEVKLEMLRGIAGTDDGGVMVDPSQQAGWTDTNSARVRVTIAR